MSYVWLPAVELYSGVWCTQTHRDSPELSDVVSIKYQSLLTLFSPVLGIGLFIEQFASA